MNTFLKIIAVVAVSLVSVSAMAHHGSSHGGSEVEILADAAFANPPGSTWVSVRCAKNSTCYPPAGYNFRHFNTETRGSDCRGRDKRKVKETKDYIKTSRECSVVGRVFLWPSAYCQGDARFCS